MSDTDTATGYMYSCISFDLFRHSLSFSDSFLFPIYHRHYSHLYIPAETQEMVGVVMRLEPLPMKLKFVVRSLIFHIGQNRIY